MAEFEATFDIQSPSLDVTYELDSSSIDAVFEVNSYMPPALDELTNVVITDPTNGQALVYNSSTQKWNNTNVIATSSWGNITGTLSNQTDLQEALDGKLDTSTSYGADLSYEDSQLQLLDQNGEALGTAVAIESSPAIDNTTITKNISDELQAINLVGLTSTITELNYCDGVTSNIQAQLNGKQPTGNYSTTDTVQTISARKFISFDESSLGSQASLLGIISTQNASLGSSLGSSSGGNWIGRTLIGAKDLTFLMGTYNGLAGLGAHSWTDAITQTGASWADFYLNPDGDKSVYIGGNNWTRNSGWLKIQNSGSTSGGNVYYNKGTSDSPTWNEIAVINDIPTVISDLTDDTSTNPVDKADTLTGLTSSVTELNVLDGITTTTEELNYCDGVTSNIQTQLNNKATVTFVDYSD